MRKTIVDQFTPFLFMGLMLMLVGGAIWYAWSLLAPQKPDVSAEDPAAIAQYKEWLSSQDLPFVGGKIKSAELPGVYQKVIEHDKHAPGWAWLG